ncbi:MAG: FkbM family methyltransferase [Phycisphaerales bacterium]
MTRIAHDTLARLERWHFARAAKHGTIDGLIERSLRNAARHWARAEMPLAIPILQALLVHRQRFWTKAGTAESRGVWDGCRVRLDLSDFYQRWAYFLGRYHEETTLRAMRRLLRPGDCFIDGGANVGLVTLMAARLVGSGGSVHAFEPHPDLSARVRWHVEANGLGHVVVHEAALSDAPGAATLASPDPWNTGAGTCATVPDRYGSAPRPRHAVACVTGDAVLADLPARTPLAIKLDVEGFELRALRGLDSAVRDRRPLVITEVNEEMLRAAGASAEGLVAHMTERGYTGYDMRPARRGMRWTGIELVPVRQDRPLPHDIAWVHPQSEFARRL